MNISSFWSKHCDGKDLNKKLLKAKAEAAGLKVKPVGGGDFMITQPPKAGAVLVRTFEGKIVANLIDGIYD